MRRLTFCLLVVLLLSGLLPAPAAPDVVCDGADDALSTGVAVSNFLAAATGTMTAWYTASGSGVTAGTCWQGRKIVGDAGGYVGLMHRDVSENLCAFNFDGNTDFVDQAHTVGTTHHLAWVHTGGTLSLYYDGALATSIASLNTQDLTNVLSICSAEAGATALGTVSEVRVYNVALSINEIVALASSRARRLGSTQPTGQWELGACADGASCDAASLLDLSGNSRHITGDNGANNTGLTGKASTVLTNPFGVQ